MLYKSANVLHESRSFKGRFNLGVARAKNWQSPFERISENPITLSGSGDNHIEDPYIWWNGETFEMIVKDMDGSVLAAKPRPEFTPPPRMASTGRSWIRSRPIPVSLNGTMARPRAVPSLSVLNY